jgi:two-component system OmpR family response regulator
MRALAPLVTATKRRILVVEDDAGIRTLLGSTLRLAGYEARAASGGTEAIEEVRRFRPDLLILDVMLPGMDGYEVTRALRAAGSPTPVLFLSALGQAADRVTGLSAGGDDYLTKPFNVEELLLRIRGILNRLHPADSGGLSSEPSLRYGDLTLDREAHEVRRGEHRIHLTPTEFRLLAYLLSSPNQVMTKKQIIEHVWGYDFTGDIRIVDTYIRYVRLKIDCFDPPLVQTVRGIGYRLRASTGAERTDE